jgi:hypothetical protein
VAQRCPTSSWMQRQKLRRGKAILVAFLHEVGRKETAEDVRNVEGGGRWAWKSIACLRTADVAKRVPSQPQGRRLASERADGEG